MATKYQLINEVYERTINTVTAPAHWQAFLRSACRNYKCRFDEQLLVFAQRPESTAVLEIEKWNKQFNRWVNKGANGIAVFDSTNPQSKRLKYYFDVSDTHEGRNSRKVPIWQRKEHFDDAVIETLENTFGRLNDKSSLANAVICAAENAAEDNLTDYLYDLKDYIQGSFLDGLGDDYIEKTYKELVTNSVAYMLLTRLDVDTGIYFTDDDFRSITDFNTKDTLNAVGLATSDIAEMGLGEIAVTVVNLQKQEKNMIRTFADEKQNSYTDNNKNIERSLENERYNLQQSGRLQSAEPNIAGRKPSDGRYGSSPWEVRIASSEVSGEKSQGDVYKSVDLLQTESTLNGSGNTVERDDGATDVTDGEITRSNGTTQILRPNEMGSDDEQYSSLSGGNSSTQSDLLLNCKLPSVEEQQNMIEKAEVPTTSAFSISQEEIDLVLQRGSGIQDGKYRIYEQYLKKQSGAENANFLKDEYGWGGSYPAVVNTDLDEGHDVKGIKISKGSIM